MAGSEAVLYEDETEAEREARLDTEVILDEHTQEAVDKLVGKLLTVAEVISGHAFYPYQRPFAARIFESLVIDDGATITALFSRQSGKTETVADVVATSMIMLPVLSKVYPNLLHKFRDGLHVGAFAPVDEQADNLFGRIASRLASDSAQEVLHDPEIADRVKGRGRVIWLQKARSSVRKTTAHPRATIEGRTYHVILVDECQGADAKVIRKSISPMGAATNATMVWTGTPTYTKGVFYATIQANKRRYNKRGRNQRQNHFQIDWRAAAKANPQYKKYVQNEMLKYGEDSDEFRLSYKCVWLLEQGMFTTGAVLDEMGDTSMQSVVHAWHRTPVVAGIDCARKKDRTVVTVVFVDWDNPDPFGLCYHQVLNWLDLEGLDWEEQYFRIVEFLSNYNIWRVGIDTGGLGDAVAQRLKILMPHTEIIELGSANSEQSERWKHLRNLIDRRQLSWPDGAKVRRLKTWRRFRQEMEDLEMLFKGPYVLAEAPHEMDAHDDYPDSLSMACVLSLQYEEETVTQMDNIFYRRR